MGAQNAPAKCKFTDNPDTPEPTSSHSPPRTENARSFGSWGAKKGCRILEIHGDSKMLSYQINAEDATETNRHTLPS